jgi:Ring finger domain
MIQRLSLLSQTNLTQLSAFRAPVHCLITFRQSHIDKVFVLKSVHSRQKMSYGCAICTEIFASSDDSEMHTVAVKACGHTFHSNCLKTWLERSRTCPTCRAVTMDSPVYLFRIHLNYVNNLNLSVFYDNPKESLNKETLDAKDREISELRRQMNSYRDAMRSIRSYSANAKTCFGHIEVELGAFGLEDMIDLSSPPVVSAPAFAVPAPAAPATTTTSSTVTSTRTSTSGPRQSSVQARRVFNLVCPDRTSSAAQAPSSSASRARARCKI